MRCVQAAQHQSYTWLFMNNKKLLINSEYKYVNEILKITYSIGGDYSEKTLMSIAKVLLKRK